MRTPTVFVLVARADLATARPPLASYWSKRIAASVSYFTGALLQEVGSVTNLHKPLAVAMLLLAFAGWGPTAWRLLPGSAMAQEDSGDRDLPDRDEPAVTPKTNEEGRGLLDLLDSADDGDSHDQTHPAGACRTTVIVAGAVTGAVVGDLIAGGLLISTLVGYLAPAVGAAAPSVGTVAAGGRAYAWNALAAFAGAGVGTGVLCGLSASQ